MLLSFITAEQNGQQKYEPNEKAKNHSTLKLEVVAEYETVGDRNLVFAFAKNKKMKKANNATALRRTKRDCASSIIACWKLLRKRQAED